METTAVVHFDKNTSIPTSSFSSIISVDGWEKLCTFHSFKYLPEGIQQKDAGHMKEDKQDQGDMLSM